MPAHGKPPGSVPQDVRCLGPRHSLCESMRWLGDQTQREGSVREGADTHLRLGAADPYPGLFLVTAPDGQRPRLIQGCNHVASYRLRHRRADRYRARIKPSDERRPYAGADVIGPSGSHLRASRRLMDWAPDCEAAFGVGLQSERDHRAGIGSPFSSLSLYRAAPIQGSLAWALAIACRMSDRVAGR